MTRTYHAPAKINLWLRVFAADASGYHPLDTLFCAVDLHDTLAIGAGQGIELAVSGADLGPIESNLAFRAAQEYFHAIGATPGISIHLHKNIPAGAGLGGGSSDAAAVLRALQERYERALPDADLLALAVRLGRDVPFFLCGSSWARARGHGELLEPVLPLPARPVLIVKPEFSIATRAAYAWLDESRRLQPPESVHPAPLQWSDVETRAVNTFETVLFARQPLLKKIRDILRASGARIALVSGSGSALFGVFDDARALDLAQRNLAHLSGLECTRTHTLE